MASSHQFKVVLLGDSEVGKTSMIQRYVHNEFTERSSSDRTATSGESTKRIRINNEEMTLEIWDTAGQERYDSLETHFYRDSDAVILVYNVTDVPSFHSACDYWIKESLKHLPDDSHVPIMVIAGNKSDLLDSASDFVDINTVREFTQSYDLVPPIETSAKTGDNIQRLFHIIATELYKRRLASTKRVISVAPQTSNGCCTGSDAKQDSDTRDNNVAVRSRY